MSTTAPLDGGLGFTISYSPEELETLHKKGSTHKIDLKALNALIREKMIRAILVRFHGVAMEDVEKACESFRMTFMRKYSPRHMGDRPLIVMRYQFGKSKRLYTRRLYFLPRDGATTLTGKFIT